MTNEKQEKRTCYQCDKPIPNIEGEYFCSEECRKEWGKSYKPLKRSKEVTMEDIKQRQLRALELGKKAGKDLADQAGEIMNS
jgi:predicted nucleic acid-binding Zn ribbon protein